MGVEVLQERSNKQVQAIQLKNEMYSGMKSSKVMPERDGNNKGKQPTLQEKTVAEAIEKVNKKIEGEPREFQFSIHEETKQITVKIINTETKELIKEIPPEKILDMIAAMWDHAGLFIDEKK